MIINGMSIFIDKNCKTVFNPSFYFKTLADGSPVVTDKGILLDTITASCKVVGKNAYIKTVFDFLSSINRGVVSVTLSAGEYIWGPFPPSPGSVNCWCEIGAISRNSLNVSTFSIDLTIPRVSVFNESGTIPAVFDIGTDDGTETETQGSFTLMGDGNLQGSYSTATEAKVSFTIKPISAIAMATVLKYYYTDNRGKPIVSSNAPTVLGVTFPSTFPYPCNSVITSIEDITRVGNKWKATITLTRY